MPNKTGRPINTGLISFIAIITLIGVPAISQRGASGVAPPKPASYSLDVEGAR